MLAHPTPHQAFPHRAHTLAQYQAMHPVWQIWRTTSAVLWDAVATLDASGLHLVQHIFRAAAWTLDQALQTMPSDVGLWLYYGPAVTATWQMQRSVQIATPATTPTQTLRLDPGAQGALQMLTAWDPVLRHRVPNHPEADVMALCQGLRLVPTTSGLSTPTAHVHWHTLTTTDTLIGLATHYLGDPEQWPELRALNHLRAPYISERLWDQYGPPLAAFELTKSSHVAPFVGAPLVNAGATTVTLPGVTLCLRGSMIVLEQWTAQGRQQEAHAVTRWDAATQVATLAEAVTHSYQAGSLMSLNESPTIQTTTVLAPGQSLAIPLSGTVTTHLLTNPRDPWGTDWALDVTGALAWTTTGDLATATGLANLQGALIRRINSALGTLPLHPLTYGSGLPSVIGGPMNHPHVISGYVRTALLQDPRVVSVPTVHVVAEGSAWHITADVQVRGTAAVLPVQTQFIA